MMLSQESYKEIEHMKAQKILEYVSNNKENIINDIKRVISIDSPSTDKDLLERAGFELSQMIKERVYAEIENFPLQESGSIFRCIIPPSHESQQENKKNLLILVHYDTVWDPGMLEIREEQNRLYGPGVYDMKSGIVMAYWAIRTIQALQKEKIPGTELKRKIVLLLTPDEEIGSTLSRSLIEKEASEAEVALVLEAAASRTGALKTARKGVGEYHFIAHGLSAHAGNEHHIGKNAITALIKQLLIASQFTNYEKGLTVNVGKIRGGTRSNVVPDIAEAWVDIRVETMEDYEYIDQKMRLLAGEIDGVLIEVKGGMNRPPMVKTDKTIELFNVARTLGKLYGLNLTETKVGGGSDGNFTAALGIPTLDGLGPEGDGAHAYHEHILIDSLVPRTALLAHMLTVL